MEERDEEEGAGDGVVVSEEGSEEDAEESVANAINPRAGSVVDEVMTERKVVDGAAGIAVSVVTAVADGEALERELGLGSDIDADGDCMSETETWDEESGTARMAALVASAGDGVTVGVCVRLSTGTEAKGVG